MSFWYYEPSRPLDVKGGIRAQSRRGEFGQSWWAKRWIEVLNSFNLGGRLDRGKTYARRGQVLSVDVRKGSVKAKVQGSYQQPYDVEIRVGMLTESDWRKLAQTLFERPVVAAKLLAGQMPENIDGVFREAGLSLFPDRRADLDTDCTCPDWSNPCKHIAAVYLLLAEEFDRDPFLVFKMRGAEREDLLAAAGLESISEMAPAAGEFTPGQAAEGSPSKPLPPDPDEFWGRTGQEEDRPEQVQIPPVSASLPKRLGSFPFWRSETGFIPAMEEMYGSASPAGLDIFLGERLPDTGARKTAGREGR